MAGKLYNHSRWHRLEMEDELNVARQHPSEFLREFLLRMVAPVVVTLLISFLLWQAYYRPIIATDKQKVAK